MVARVSFVSSASLPIRSYLTSECTDDLSWAVCVSSS